MLDQLSQPQRERLFHIDFRACFLGTVTRQNLIRRFGIKPAAATRDITLYRRIAPNNLDFDASTKVYRCASTFASIFQHEPGRSLAAIAHGIGDDLGTAVAPHLSTEHPLRLNPPQIEIIAAVSRAIAGGDVLKITYHSLNSGKSSREIVPHALVDTGVRWHTRAWDRRHRRFGDFVLTRIDRPTPLPDAPMESETREMDDQWMRMVTLELSPHPGLDHPTTIARDYGMANNLLRVRLRAALCGYALLYWGVDPTEDHRLDPNRHHLWLTNGPTLYGVENLAIAVQSGA